MYQPKPNEAVFNIRPIGIKYICEHCGEGEMVRNPNGLLRMSNPPLIPHHCTKCDGELLLPKTYPYIEWIPEEGCNESPKTPNSD